VDRNTVIAVLAVSAMIMAGPMVARPDSDSDSESGSRDAYLRGYIDGVLAGVAERDGVVFGVRDGIVYLDSSVSSATRRAVESRLGSIPDVDALRWVSQPPVAAALSVDGTPDEEVFASPEKGFALLPSRTLFEPLSADPRWPRFSASVLRYRDDPELGKVGAVSLGGTLPIWQADLPGEGRWEFAIQGSVFSIFDLDASSLDLVNSDFFAGFPVYARWGEFSLMLRPYHQSSHLGDEFLLRDRVERVNVSFEGVDFLASYDILDFARFYGGAGILVHREPDDIDRRSVQAGVELRSPIAFFGGRVRPIAALDVSRQEENDWKSDYSARVGLQLENSRILGGRRLQILAEYYRGFSPNGQFFRRRIEYAGVGFHFHF